MIFAKLPGILATVDSDKNTPDHEGSFGGSGNTKASHNYPTIELVLRVFTTPLPSGIFYLHQ